MAVRTLSILHVIDWISERYGGPTRNVRDVAAALADRGHRVVVLTTDRDGPRRFPESERGRLPAGPDWQVIRSPEPGSERLARVRPPGMGARGSRPTSSISAGSTTRRARSAGAIAVRRGVPFVQQLHGAATDYHWRQKRWKKAPWEALVQRPLLTRASAAIVQTEIEARRGKKVFPTARMRLVPPPVIDDEAATEPGGALPEGHHRRSGSSGRLSEKKGAPVLLAAFAGSAAEFPEARLIVAGPDDEGIGATDAAGRSHRLGLDDTRQLPGDGGRRREGRAAGGVRRLRSSLRQRELRYRRRRGDGGRRAGRGERARSGSPATSRRRGRGWSRRETEEGIAAALRRLLGDPEARERVGAAGRRFALSSYTRSASMAALERIYEDAVG